ncbi:lung seven transmembrane receptor-domain-containing protein [Pavlovales sp. CCMP2436]|nr:lung seven transmembrane receptor-domain-containing protein [Pavlovales sp. CCMP2436]
MATRLARLVLACCWLLLADANIYRYTRQPLEPDVIQYRRVGMYAPEDSPSSGPPGNGDSLVKVDVTFSRLSARSSGLIQVLIFHSENMDLVGYQEPGTIQKTYCCTNSLRTQNVPGCAEVGHLIVSPSGSAAAGGLLWQRDLTFGVNQSTSQLQADFEVEKSGVYYLLFSSCDLSTGVVFLNGATSWVNPYGYLPGELFHFLPFYGAMSLVYLSLGVLWFILCVRYLQQVLRVQTCISGVIALGMVETTTWYLDYVNFNSSGLRGLWPVVIGVLASTVKKTVSRLLVLVVSLGYGVVRPTLGAVTNRVMLLGLLYLLFSMILDTVSNLSPITEVSVPLRLLFILPVALLDAVFYWWIFSGLSRTLSQLASRKQTAKLDLYRRFSRVLIASIVLSAAWVSWQMVVIISDSLDDRWDSLWVFDAFWHLLYAVILMAICFLWSPSKNNLQYAYSQELRQEDEGEEGEGEEAAAKDPLPDAFAIEEDVHDVDVGTGKRH